MKQVKSSDIIGEIIFPLNTPLMLGDKVVGMVDEESNDIKHVSCKIFSNCLSAECVQTGDKQYSVTAIKIKENDNNE